MWGLRVLRVARNLRLFARKTRDLLSTLDQIITFQNQSTSGRLNRISFPAWSAFGCMRITETGRELFDAHIFFTLDNHGEPCAACFSNSHTAKSRLRRKGYPINYVIPIFTFLKTVLDNSRLHRRLCHQPQQRVRLPFLHSVLLHLHHTKFPLLVV